MIFLIFLFLIFVSRQSAGAFAEENVRMPPLEENQKGSLSITVSYKDAAGTKHRCSGVRLQLYQAASLTVQADGAAVCTLMPEFAGSGLDLAKMTASESLRAAEALEAVIQEKRLSGTEGVTNADGIVCFADLNPGVYLLVQGPAEKKAAAKVKMNPYLISVPQAEEETTGTKWNYAVEMRPKAELCRTPQPDQPADRGKTSGGTGSVRTEDATPLQGYAAAVILAGAALFFLAAGRRRTK